MIDLDAIKARLAEWRRLKSETTMGAWVSEQVTVEVERNGETQESYPQGVRTARGTLLFLMQREPGYICGEDYANADFIVYAHNTPIEDDLAALLAEVEQPPLVFSACDHLTGMYEPTHDMEPEWWITFLFCPHCGTKLAPEATPE